MTTGDSITTKEPSHIQVTPLQGDLWGWSVCFFGGPERDGVTHSWQSALDIIWKEINDVQS